jgi:hypothetical protein
MRADFPAQHVKPNPFGPALSHEAPLMKPTNKIGGELYG